MTVRLGNQIIELAGHCPSEEAEQLVEHLLAAPDATVDWRACEHAHTAILQVLLAAGRPLRGPPKGAFLAQWVQPLLYNV